jgi:lipid-A-disaccharide synthase
MPKKIVIIAGEESGDYHASSFVRLLKQQNPDWKFSGIGGRHLQRAGMKLLFNLSAYGVTGITEVFRYFFIIKKAFNLIINHIKTENPDLIILVDYPGFNLRLAKRIRRFSLTPILYYIAPQIWAWKPKRLKTIQKYISHMAVILPFEKELYQQAEVPVSFVGHPIIRQLEEKKKSLLDKQSLGLPDNKILVAMLPGSRRNEIKRLLPVFIETIKQFQQEDDSIHFVIPVAKSLNFDYVKSLLPGNLPVSLVYGHAIDVMMLSEAVVVASGTASLECALLGRPSCLVYKISAATYSAATQLVRIPYIGLANILSGKMIMPELIQDDCEPTSLSNMVHFLVYDEAFRENQVEQFNALYSTLSSTAADCTIESIIDNLLPDPQEYEVDKNTEKV